MSIELVRQLLESRRYRAPEGEGEGGEGGEPPKGEPAKDEPAAGQRSGSLMDEGDKGDKGDGGEPAKEWFLSEGVKGDGEPPEWFNADKYKSVADQAKAQRELEKKLGGFTGAPEKYELTLPEGVEGEFDPEHPILESFMEKARAANMSQETFNDLMHEFVKYETEQNTVDLEHERKQLGPKADARISNVREFLQGNLDDEAFQALRGTMQSAQVVEAFESLMSRVSPKAPPADDSGIDPASARERLEEMRNKRGEDGRRLYEVDPEHRKRVRAEYERVYGTGPDRQIVGG
jgi:hypothetical protein